MRLVATILVLLIVSGCDSNSACGGGSLLTTDIVIGSGNEVVDSDMVRVDYVGRLEDGSVFDEGMDVEFDLQMTVPGFREGMVGMMEGGRREITIPPELGFGEAGVPGVIPSCETLTFEVTLLAIIN